MSWVKLFSVDMFQTLADIGSLKYVIWHQFLGDRFSRESADRYWNRASELIVAYFRNQKADDFESIQTIFEKCYEALQKEIPDKFDSEMAAVTMCDHHPLSVLYTETIPFLERAAKLAPVCLSSDTDDVMLKGLDAIFPFDRVFTSEALKAYKSQDGGIFFRTVLEHYDVEPSSVLHIGDSTSDIFGAYYSGIKSCWINRSKEVWNKEPRPDYIVDDLMKIFEIV